MGRTSTKTSKDSQRKHKPATSPEARENQLVNYAMELAERQLREGIASSQVITHYLKIGSSKEKLELEKLKEENKLLIAKTEALQSAKQSEVEYAEVLKAMRTYSGNGGADEY